MATRTIQFYGLGYGSTPASLQVTQNGNTIFDGVIPTVDQPPPALGSQASGSDVVLFTMEVDTSFSGTVPMTCTVTNGTVSLFQVYANYSPIRNPVFTEQQWGDLAAPTKLTLSEKVAVYSSVANPPFTAEETAVLENPATSPAEFGRILSLHNCKLIIGTGATGFNYMNEAGDYEVRLNPTLNGVAQTYDPSQPGTFRWNLTNGSILGYNLNVSAAFV